jgi:hypothetical protein
MRARSQRVGFWLGRADRITDGEILECDEVELINELAAEQVCSVSPLVGNFSVSSCNYFYLAPSPITATMFGSEPTLVVCRLRFGARSKMFTQQKFAIARRYLIDGPQV